MQIRGWIYVLSNRAMPGLLKIGYSTKDPLLRIEELNSTGLPFPFQLEYDALVIGPREVETAVHKRLSSQREAKEFFSADLESAVDAIAAAVEKLEREILLERWSQTSEGLKSPKPIFTLAESKAAIGKVSRNRLVEGTMRYVCQYCGTEATVRSSHIAHCSYCGRTGDAI